jgi:hypothetical protein
MVKLNNNFAQQQPNSQQTFANQNQPINFGQNAQAQEQPSFDSPLASQKGFFQVPEKFLQLVPLIPFAIEAMTGQKVPPTGVLAEILSGVQQVQLSLSQVIINQKQI